MSGNGPSMVTLLKINLKVQIQRQHRMFVKTNVAIKVEYTHLKLEYWLCISTFSSFLVNYGGCIKKITTDIGYHCLLLCFL